MMKPWECLMATGIVVFVGAALLPLKSACACTRATAIQCLSKLKTISSSLSIYAADFDDRMPNRLHWVDSLNLYVGKPPAFVDTVVKKKGEYGYAYDSRLSLKSISAFPDLNSQTATFDSANLGKNASDPFTSLPNPGRHDKRNNVAYLDGHSKSQRVK